jgi:ribose-phosphate pyrophosphokinase
MLKLNGHEVNVTFFPDATSQVWKIDPKFFMPDDNVIRWEFANEAEFMQLAQLKNLLDMNYGFNTTLELPYLPYARQDKEIVNEATFAFYTFAELLNTLNFAAVYVYDPHNVDLTNQLIDEVKITMPNVLKICQWAKNAVPVYPDAGAAKRYGASNRALRCEKVREASTGKILGVKVIGKVKPVSYVIIDDICDGGRTFIEVAKKLYEAGAKEVHLYISHGIFSKGLEPLRQAGIKRIFTRNGEVKGA